MNQFSKFMWRGFAMLFMAAGLFLFELVSYRHDPESMVIPFFMGLDIILMLVIVGILLWLASSL